MTQLKPWADGPFELILHAELHLQSGNEFDRRMALISFDNAIEVAIHTYLSLHPSQRSNRQITKEEKEIRELDYISKLEFLYIHLESIPLSIPCGKDEIVWYHKARNEQYHEGRVTFPRNRELEGIRNAALSIFSVLYDVPDVENELKIRIAELTGNKLPKRTSKIDKIIDKEHGVICVAGNEYYASEILYNMDPNAYFEIGTNLHSESLQNNDLEGEED